MRKIKCLFDGHALRVMGFIVLAALVSVSPYGCKKKEEPKPVQEQPAADPAKEHFNKGVQHSMKGEYDLAIKEYEETLKINPKSSEAHNNMGFAYFDKGDYDKAVEHQKTALEINPHLANGYYGLALALEKKGDKKGAIENWKEFLKYAEPHSKWWMNAQAHLQALEGKPKEGEKATTKK